MRAGHGRSNTHNLIVTSDGINTLLDGGRGILDQLYARARLFEALAAWSPADATDLERHQGHFRVDDADVAFRIDYFERLDLTRSATDPSQAHRTTRILTVMLPSE